MCPSYSFNNQLLLCLCQETSDGRDFTHWRGHGGHVLAAAAPHPSALQDDSASPKSMPVLHMPKQLIQHIVQRPLGFPSSISGSKDLC